MHSCMHEWDSLEEMLKWQKKGYFHFNQVSKKYEYGISLQEHLAGRLKSYVAEDVNT